MNQVILIGRLVKDVEVFYSQSGTIICKFILAVNKDLYGEKKEEAEKSGKPTADFIGITVFGKQGENCANYLSKGKMCAIEGRINTSKYTNEDEKVVYKTDVIADKVRFLSPKDNNRESVFEEDEGDQFY